MADLLPMPIHLLADNVARRASAGRMVFVCDPRGIGGDAPIDVFGRGLHAVFGNYLTARSVGGGLAAACDDQSFLSAVRDLTDTVYAEAGTTLDASPSNAALAHVIAGVYPDAQFILVGDVPCANLIEAERVVQVDAWRPDLAPPAAPFPSPAREPSTLRAPVFVVGCPRSGTTWVQNLLAAHPGLGGPTKETAAFVALRALRDNPAVSLDALRGFAAALFAQWSDVRLIEKTPIHAQHLDLIAELFPDASVVGVHRDGRDVVRSLLEVEAGTRDVAQAAQWWVTNTEAVAAFTSKSPRARDERYESWLAQPVLGAVDVLAWLGLPPDEAVIDEIRRRAPERVSQYNTTGAIGEGKWRSLPARDLRTIYRIAGTRLVELGYATEDVTTQGARRAGFLRGVLRR